MADHADKLLGRKTSGNVQKVLFLLEEIGAPYEREDYGRQFQNTATPEYQALNPTSKVPTLVDGDVVIWESNTILRYLAALHAPQLAGRDAGREDAGRALDGFPAGGRQPRLPRGLQGREAACRRSGPRSMTNRSGDLLAQMKILDGHLAGKSYLALDRLTLADIALAPILGRCLDFPIDRPASAGPRGLVCRELSARPAFKAATA